MCNDLIYNIRTKVMESTWIQGIFVFSLTIYFVAQFILQMKQVVLTLFFLLSVFHCSAQEKLLSLDGTFQNNNLVVYNLRNYQFQRIYNGDFSMYVYIDQYYRVYPGYTKNINGLITVEYLDPFLKRSVYDVNQFNDIFYIQNQSKSITSI
jgi:hypothetical protein